MKSVGFAGIGTMGSGMSQNLVKAGFNVFVYNRTKVKAEAIKGAVVVGTPAELCDKAEIIFISVTNDAALKEVLFSSNGIIGRLSQKNTLVDCSTTSIELTEQIAKECAEKKASFLDAPVTGSKKGAEEGTLLFMIGGKKEAFEKHRAVFEAVGKRFVHCGPNTYGQRMKIALNLTQSMILESYLEGVVFALKNGVNLAAIEDVFKNSGPRNNAADMRMPTIIRHDFTPNFFLALMNKDLQLARHELKRLGLDFPLAEAVIKVYQEAVRKGLGEEDWSAIAKLLEQESGVRIR